MYADDGNLAANNFNPIGTYNGNDITYTLDNTVETSFLTGTKYRFKVSAINDIGEGPTSNEIRIVLAGLPDKPNPP